MDRVIVVLAENDRAIRLHPHEPLGPSRWLVKDQLPTLLPLAAANGKAGNVGSDLGRVELLAAKLLA